MTIETVKLILDLLFFTALLAAAAGGIATVCLWIRVKNLTWQLQKAERVNADHLQQLRQAEKSRDVLAEEMADMKRDLGLLPELPMSEDEAYDLLDRVMDHVQHDSAAWRLLAKAAFARTQAQIVDAVADLAMSVDAALRRDDS